jgi:hypothetical protein
MKTREQYARDFVNARIPEAGIMLNVMEVPVRVRSIAWSKRNGWAVFGSIYDGYYEPNRSEQYVWYTASSRQIGEIREAVGETVRMPR